MRCPSLNNLKIVEDRELAAVMATETVGRRVADLERRKKEAVDRLFLAKRLTDYEVIVREVGEVR